MNAIHYAENFGSPECGEGLLVVKRLNKEGTWFALVGYVPPGVDTTPIVFARGTLEDCRQAYRAAKRWMAKTFVGVRE